MDILMEDPVVVSWLGHYNVEWRPAKFVSLRLFHRWLQDCSDEKFAGLRGLSPSALVDFQQNADKKNKYLILDALQTWILSKEGTYLGLEYYYGTVRGFFKKSRAALPDDEFEIVPNREAVKERMNVQVIKTLLDNVGYDRKALYLTLWMSLMDLERFMEFNQKGASALVQHLKTKGVDEPFLWEYPGRKKKRHKQKGRCHTYIGHDALVAWKDYFDRMRGWPADGEAILLDGSGRGITKHGIRMRHFRLLEKLKYVKRVPHCKERYGYGLHQFRDTGKTFLHVEALKDGLDLQCVEFWMGHIVDPLNYDKFMENLEYTLKHYRIAEKYLNIISNLQTDQAQQEEIERMREALRERDDAFHQMAERLTSMEKQFSQLIEIRKTKTPVEVKA